MHIDPLQQEFVDLGFKLAKISDRRQELLALMAQRDAKAASSVNRLSAEERAALRQALGAFD